VAPPPRLGRVDGVELAGKVVVITGSGHGIGAGLAVRIAADHPAALVLVDHDGPAASRVAAAVRSQHPSMPAEAMTADVVDPRQVEAFVERAESTFGRLDVFVANAGVGAGGGLDAADSVWSTAWDVNVMAHVHAARLVVPRMLARGGGCFVTTASAAGLLTNLGNAPYSVTKHAAVAFAEWLAVTYGDRGLHVACICPMGVDTAMLRSGLGRLEGASVAAERVISVEAAAEEVVAGLRSGRFLILTHPETAVYEQHRAADRDRWLAGMRRLQREVEDSLRRRE
jgi:NAD(P)-dependent dehydrogenase (short-subunit alcohol dehydrogenase family)